MKTTLVLLVSAIFLAGCASTKFGRADLAERAKVGLVGKSKKDILICAGVPVRSQQVENMEFLTYHSGGDSDAYVAGGVNSSAGGGVVSVKHRYCEVTFILKAGYSGGYSGDIIAFIIRETRRQVLQSRIQPNSAFERDAPKAAHPSI